VELAVVIAVILMLLAVLLPGMNRARAASKIVQCKSNLNNIAKAWLMYLDHWDGYFPKGVDLCWNYGGKQGAGGRDYGIDPDDPAFSFPKPLNVELNLPVVTDDAKVFLCPADEGGADVPKGYPHYDYKGTSYCMNTFLVGQSKTAIRLFDKCARVFKDANDYIGSVKLDQIRTPSRILLMGDAGWINDWEVASPSPIWWHGRERMHNLAFVDGHVEFLEVRKAMHVTPEYSVVPFEELTQRLLECQGQE